MLGEEGWLLSPCIIYENITFAKLAEINVRFFHCSQSDFKLFQLMVSSVEDETPESLLLTWLWEYILSKLSMPHLIFCQLSFPNLSENLFLIQYTFKCETSSSTLLPQT